MDELIALKKNQIMRQRPLHHMLLQNDHSIQNKIVHHTIGFVHSTALHFKSHNPIIWSCMQYNNA